MVDVRYARDRNINSGHQTFVREKRRRPWETVRFGFSRVEHTKGTGPRIAGVPAMASIVRVPPPEKFRRTGRAVRADGPAKDIAIVQVIIKTVYNRTTPIKSVTYRT